MGKSQGPETGKWKSLGGTSLIKRAEEAQVSFPGMASPAQLLFLLVLLVVCTSCLSHLSVRPWSLHTTYH